MKKTSHALATKQKTARLMKAIDSTVDMTDLELLEVEDNLASDQFAVAGRGDEASSSGHRVEPIVNDEEGNAEQLVEEGLHGYLHATPKNSHQNR